MFTAEGKKEKTEGFSLVKRQKGGGAKKKHESAGK